MLILQREIFTIQVWFIHIDPVHIKNTIFIKVRFKNLLENYSFLILDCPFTVPFVHPEYNTYF